MNSKLWIRKALSTCLVVATIATYSMVTLANTDKFAGELLVSGKAVSGQTPSVKVNGETAQSGRSIFTASTIATPDNASATINLGKAGKIELAPNTIVSVNFNDNNINGELVAGRITVLNSSESVSIKSPNGKIAMLNVGESVDAAQTGAQTDDDNDDNGGGFLIYAIILGGAAAAIILAATTDNNRIALGGGTTVVSTTR